MKIISGITLVFLVLMMAVSCNSGKDVKVQIDTDYGSMVAVLFDDTPLHKENFIKLVEEGFYDGLEFHRIIEGFMIQGGDPNSRNAGPNEVLGGGGPGYTIPAEIGRPHYKGALAAARTGDAINPQKASSGSQFYIVHGTHQDDSGLDYRELSGQIKYSESQREKYKERGGAPMLDGQYTVFGQIVEGMEVIDKIAAVKTSPQDRPLQPVRMTVKLVK